MSRLILLITFMVASTASAVLSIKDTSDRAIFEDAVVLSSQMLSKNTKDKAGNDLLKFAGWMDSTDARIKEMKAKAVFGEKINALSSAGVSKESLLKKMMARQEELRGESSKRMLYIVIAYQVDPQDKGMADLYEELKASRFDLGINKLISSSKKPERVDLEVEKQKEAEEAAAMEKENDALSKNYRESEASEDDIEKILDNVKFKNFAYSESTILDAINRVTHKLYWYGIQMKVTGNRLSYTEVRTSTNGAQYYYGPLLPPNFDEFAVENKTIRQVLDHMSTSLGILWRVEDGLIVIYDGEVPDPEMPEGGFVAADMQKLIKGSLKDLLKYRDKVIEMKGLITGIGKQDYRTDYLAIDGGLTRIYVNKADVDAGVYKRLDTSIDKWKKDGGKAALTKKLNEMKKTGEEINYQKVGNASAYIHFRAKVTGVDRGRLVFKAVEFIRIEESGEYLIKKMK
jgi:hypothetical protein